LVFFSLLLVSLTTPAAWDWKNVNVLGGECAVVHKEKVNVADVVDEEGLVAGGVHVAGLLVRAVSDL